MLLKGKEAPRDPCQRSRWGRRRPVAGSPDLPSRAGIGRGLLVLDTTQSAEFSV